ncbi:uncharacterized protein [Littorina saxatilis]|uniref:uncharacterized protein n=1 Tax=Littorina saxatilis TaxID=31220 RepID=UPI0038B68DAF
MAGLSCQVCQKHKRNHPDRVLLTNKFEECTRTIKRNVAKPIDEFFHVINSFLNGSGGSVIIHADQDIHIDLLDQKVDCKLLALIPDNALYQEVYERYLLDAQHVLYRVLPRVGSRPYSVWDFNTRFSVSKGTEPPTYGQMNDFVDHITGFRPKEGRDFSVNRGPITLIKDQQVMVTRTLRHVGNGRSNNAHNARPVASIPLSENICTQAKAFDPKMKVAEYCWEKSEPYISAFTKIQGGGSVYIGIQEEKTASGCATGKLITQGVCLTPKDQDEIRALFTENIDKELMWIGTREHQQDVVMVNFLPVIDNGQPVASMYVVEVKINYYYGLCFYSQGGPKLYTTSQKNGIVNTGIVIPVEDWLKKFNKYIDLLINGRPQLASWAPGACQASLK